MTLPTLGTIVLACATTAVACAGKSPPSEETVQKQEADPTPPSSTPARPPLSPKWKKGDHWSVHYRVRTPSPAKSAHPPARYEEHDWEYTVEDVSSTGNVRVSARWQGDEPLEWRMAFEPSGNLVSVDPPNASAESIAKAPFVPLDFAPSDRLSVVWPKFPLVPDAFDELEDGDLTQRTLVQAAPGSGSSDAGPLEVRLVHRGTAHGMQTERTAVQLWERDRPWWTSIELRSRTTYQGETYEELDLEGRVTSWGTP